MEPGTYMSRVWRLHVATTADPIPTWLHSFLVWSLKAHALVSLSDVLDVDGRHNVSYLLNSRVPFQMPVFQLPDSQLPVFRKPVSQLPGSQMPVSQMPDIHPLSRSELPKAKLLWIRLLDVRRGELLSPLIELPNTLRASTERAESIGT